MKQLRISLKWQIELNQEIIYMDLFARNIFIKDAYDIS